MFFGLSQKKIPPFSKINNPIGFLWLFQVIHTTVYKEIHWKLEENVVDEKNSAKRVEKKNFFKNKKYRPSTKTYPKDNF